LPGLFQILLISRISAETA
jgi:hypothetical protein